MVRMRFGRARLDAASGAAAQPVAQALGLAAHLRDPRPPDPARGAARPHRDAQPRRPRHRQRRRFHHARNRAHPAARHRCAGVRPDLPQGRRRLSLRPPRPRCARRADRRPAGVLLRLGARQIRPAARDMHGRRRATSTAARSRPAGRSPMATTRRKRRPRAGKARGSGPARSTARATGARCMAAWPKASTQRPAASSTGCARCFDFRDAGAICLYHEAL